MTQSESDEALFARIYDDNWGDVRRYCQRRSATEADADDLVAETFMIAWRRVDELAHIKPCRPWLFGVARNLLREHYRRADWVETITQRLSAELLGSPGPLIPGEDQSRVDLQIAIEALHQLPEPDRELIELVVWEKLSHAEIADVLGCSSNAVTIRLHRARARLATAFTERTQHG